MCQYFTFYISYSNIDWSCEVIHSFEEVVVKENQHFITLVILSVFFQDCPGRQELHGSLKQVQKHLSAHEATYMQSLRNLKKKINLLQSSAAKQSTRATNSK